MPLPWSTADVLILQQAIARGEQRVRFSDGREVEYRSIDQLMKALALVEQAVAVASATNTQRVTYGTYSKD